MFLFEMLDTLVLNVAPPTIGHELASSTTGLQRAGLVGVAVTPAVGGFVLAVAPWQVLLPAAAGRRADRRAGPRDC